MQQNNQCCEHGCQLCQKQAQIDQMNHRRKRDLSLQSIYRKDFKATLYNMANQVWLPKGSKNESSNIQFKQKKYLHLSSTYGINYENKKGDKPHYARSGQSIINPEGMGDNFMSTYNNNFHEHPMNQDRKSFKIADFQFYNIKSTLPKDTEYKQQYKKISMQHDVPNLTNKKAEEKHQSIRLFETTQKCHFRQNPLQKSRAILPVHNMSTLPTSHFLYNSTYRNEFQEQGIRSVLSGRLKDPRAKHFSDKKGYI